MLCVFRVRSSCWCGCNRWKGELRQELHLSGDEGEVLNAGNVARKRGKMKDVFLLSGCMNGVAVVAKWEAGD